MLTSIFIRSNLTQERENMNTLENGSVAYRNEAIHMLTRADVTPTEDYVRVLTNDIVALAEDELDAGDDTNCIPDTESALEAVTILRDRIGGLRNLQAYCNTLLAGEKRK